MHAATEPSRVETDHADDVWIVIPAFNEEASLPEVIRAVSRRYRNIVLVDDGSADGTGATALRFGTWYLKHVVNCGQGAALQTGIDFALLRGARAVVTFDADGQHRADEIQMLVGPVLSGEVDISLGSRFLGRAIGLSWDRWVVLKVGIALTRLCSGIPVTDTHNGFRAMSRHAAERIRLMHDGMAHASEIVDWISRLRLRFREIPVTITYTSESKKKGQTSWNCLRIVADLALQRLVR